MKRSIIFFAVLFFWNVMEGQLDLQLRPMDDIKISLLTCDPGDQLYSTFGHSAVRVFNERTGIDVVYNYGTFDTDTPGFYTKFLRGKLPYRLSKATYAAFLYEYNFYKRGVKELVLNLSTREEVQMIEFLETNYLPENRSYPYDFFFDNCATRIRDIIPEINPNVEWQSVSEEITFRQMLHQFLPGMPWSEFGIDLIIGSVADREASDKDQMFLPGYLHDHFEAATLSEDANLIKESYRVLTFEEEAKERMKSKWFTPHIIFGLLILLEIFILFFIKRKSKAIQWYNRLFFFSIGLASLLMLGLWFLTDHQATGNNWNILWASPLYLFFPWMKRSDLKQKMGYLLMGLAGMSLINIYLQFLPQDFNPYNTLMLLLLMYKVWKCVKPKNKTV
ncbi:MAG: DUF4105 domain-containing protein [Saprospiraceae bacterium]|nr:DUF4105 domain-containing protein [Saprospiraceae bacterium]